LAEKIRKRIGLPVIGVGRIDTLELAEDLVQKRKVGLVALGRPLLADPQWVEKAINGKEDEIIPCIYCNNCIDVTDKGEPLRCAVNASTGREDEVRLKPANRAKMVLIVGGGPSGLEAATVLALRGYKVVLFEKDAELGGQLLLASKPPRKQRLQKLIDYYANRVRSLHVDVRIGQESTLATIMEANPCCVILATGSSPLELDINVTTDKKILNYSDALSGVQEVGERVAIIGGGQIGCETAEYLTERGRQVVVIEVADIMCSMLSAKHRHFLLYQLASKNVTMVTSTRAEEISDEGVHIFTRKGKRQIVKADSVVIAIGLKSDHKLVEQLKGKIDFLGLIGDCVEPRRIADAIREGARIGYDL